VRDHVVELARDARALVGDGAPPVLVRALASGSDGVAEEPGRRKTDEDRNRAAQAATVDRIADRRYRERCSCNTQPLVPRQLGADRPDRPEERRGQSRLPAEYEEEAHARQEPEGRDGVPPGERDCG
jgi:hypothetical protein